MKKTDGLTRAIGLLMFAAMLCYMGFAVARRVTDQTQTALAAEASITLSADMSGLVIRQEQLVCSGEKYIDVTAGDGQRLAAGEELARIYGSAEALERAAELSSISRELAELEEDNSEANQSGGAAVYATLAGLAAAVQQQDMNAAESYGKLLSETVLESGSGEISADYAETLRARYERLSAAASLDVRVLSAECAGLFSRSTDGFEDLNGASAAGITASELRTYMDEERSGGTDALGRLVSGFEWYYAALMDSDDAARLNEGDTVQLSFSRYCARRLPAQVEHISAPDDGETAVVFSLDEGLSELLSARKTAAELVFESYEGTRIPAKGLYRYWAGYVPAEAAASMTPGAALTLQKGSWSEAVTVSEIGDSEEIGGEDCCLVVVCWLWTEDNAPPQSDAETTLVSDETGQAWKTVDYYAPENQYDRLCVFTMTGLQAERKKVELVYAGEDYVLLSSESENALRPGNEVILNGTGLYDGKIYD